MSQLEEQVIHDILRNQRRRLTNKALLETDTDQLTVRDLADWIAAEEAETTSPSKNKRQSVYTSLLQNHLPMLEKHGIIEYDTDHQEIRLQDRIHELEMYMQIDSRDQFYWTEVMLLLSFGGAFSLIAQMLGAPVISSIEPTVIALIFFVLISTSAIYRILRESRIAL